MGIALLLIEMGVNIARKNLVSFCRGFICFSFFVQGWWVDCTFWWYRESCLLSTLSSLPPSLGCLDGDREKLLGVFLGIRGSPPPLESPSPRRNKRRRSIPQQERGGAWLGGCFFWMFFLPFFCLFPRSLSRSLWDCFAFSYCIPATTAKPVLSHIPPFPNDRTTFSC